MKGSIVTRDDFLNYKANFLENQIIFNITNNLRLYLPPPPSGSIVLAYFLKLMKGYDLKHYDRMSNEEKALFYHRYLEALKHAFAKRAELGDQDFPNNNQKVRIKDSLIIGFIQSFLFWE